MPLLLVALNLPRSITAGTWKLKTGGIVLSMYQNCVCTTFWRVLVDVSFQGGVVMFRPVPAVEPDLPTGKNEAILILSQLSKLTAPLCLELFFHTFFQFWEAWNRSCWQGEYSALSSIITLFWYQQVILRRRLKLILALFRPTSSSGNSKPMQIAEGRSHGDIRWLQAVSLGCLLSSSEYIRKVHNESKQKQAYTSLCTSEGL